MGAQDHADRRRCRKSSLIAVFVVCVVAISPAVASASQQSTTGWRSMTDPLWWKTFQASAMREYLQNVGLPPAAASPSDADAEPPTLERAVELRARTLSPGGFAGIYSSDGIIHVGFTADADRNLAELMRSFPSADIRVYAAQYTTADLIRIQDEITDMMAADTNMMILSVGGDDERNLVEVGVSDLRSPLAKSIVSRYGDAVDVFEDEPLEPLTGSAATTLGPAAASLAPSVITAAASDPQPGRDVYRDPMVAGMHISGRGEDCTAGFMYRGTLLPVPSGAGGVITAGHCFDGQLPLTEWRQGGRVLGPFTRRRNVNNSRADAGTITTEFVEGGGFRGISNRVYIAPGAETIRITRRKALNSGRRGEVVCISGAYSGFHCGRLSAVGPRGPSGGGIGFNYRIGRNVLLRGIYRATMSKACRPGDSGAPAFTADGTALGIFFARTPSNPTRCFFSQIRNVEAELRVPTFTGG